MHENNVYFMLRIAGLSVFFGSVWDLYMLSNKKNVILETEGLTEEFWLCFIKKEGLRGL